MLATTDLIVSPVYTVCRNILTMPVSSLRHLKTFTINLPLWNQALDHLEN